MEAKIKKKKKDSNKVLQTKKTRQVRKDVNTVEKRDIRKTVIVLSIYKISKRANERSHN